MHKLQNSLWRNILGTRTKKEEGAVIETVGAGAAAIASLTARMQVPKITGQAQREEAQVRFKPSKEDNLKLPRGDHPQLFHNKENICFR